MPVLKTIYFKGLCLLLIKSELGAGGLVLVLLLEPRSGGLTVPLLCWETARVFGYSWGFFFSLSPLFLGFKHFSVFIFNTVVVV